MRFNNVLSLLPVAGFLRFAQAEQLANDPPSYFGGANHEDYLDWITNNDILAKYNSSVFLPSRDELSGAAVHWSADDEYLYLAVAARAQGWLGFGLSEPGGMYGSDLALFTASRPDEIVDAHVVSEPLPRPDDCQQDWELISSHVTTDISVAESRQASDDDKFLMFEVRRKLDTGDPQDIALIRDNLLAIPEQRIIAAWGDSAEVSYHGTDHVARGSIRIFQTEVEEPSFEALMAKDADGSFFVGARNYTIPSNDTTYMDFCVSRQDLIDQGVPDTDDTLSVIGFRPILDQGYSASFVHHYVVTGIFNASTDACGEDGMDLVYVWAPGDGPFALPEFLGGNLFGDEGFQGFNIEIHYDNPRLETGVVDSSGVEIFFSTTRREVEIGVLQVGDPFVALYGQAVGSGYTMHQFDCPSSCSGLYLSDGEPVTVVREYLHMHVHGARMVSEQIRDGTVVREATTEVWDFNANGNVPTKQAPYEILPGDSFRTRCYYEGQDDTVFGLGSREEMCMTFLYYYPRKTFRVPTPDGGEFSIPWLCGHGVDFSDNACFAEHSAVALESEDGLDREFGVLKAQCLVEGGTGGDVALDFDSSTTLVPGPAPAVPHADGFDIPSLAVSPPADSNNQGAESVASASSSSSTVDRSIMALVGLLFTTFIL